MNKQEENRNALIAGLITGALILWLIMSTGCKSRADQQLERPGHWPGWIFEPNAPLYGPHDRQTQIKIRNAYSDGWQDRGKARKYEKN